MRISADVAGVVRLPAWQSALGSDAHVGRIPKTLPIHVIGGTDDPVGENGKGVQRLIDLYSKNGLTISSRSLRRRSSRTGEQTNKGEVTTDLKGWLLQFA